MPDAFVYRVRMVSTGWGGAPGLNTHYFLRNLAEEPDMAAGALACVQGVQLFWASLTPLFPEIWAGQVSSEVDILNTDNGDLDSSQTVDGQSGLVGDVDAGFGPQAAMLCGSLATPGIIDGRKVKGRCFVGPLVVGGNGDGTPTPTQASLLETAMAGLIEVTGIQPPLAVWSRRRPVSVEHPTGLGGSAHLVSACVVQDRFAILRSRRQ